MGSCNSWQKGWTKVPRRPQTEPGPTYLRADGQGAALWLVGCSLSKEEASCTTCDFRTWLFHFCVCTAPVLGYACTFPKWLRLSSA